MELTHSTSPTEISTRLYVPGWWVHAWEQFLSRQNTSDTTTPPGVESIIFPSLDIVQLNLVAMLCAQIQQQMLSGTWKSTDPITLLWSDAKKLISSTDTTSISKLSIAMEQLGGLRLGVHVDGQSTHQVVPLFQSESWSKNLDDPNDMALTLIANSQTLELLIGYTDGHLDFLRGIKNKPRTAEILADKPPLVLWKPVWLELPLAEQAVYLRLEKAMQWDMTWLQLDGVFGAPVEQMFENVRMPKRGANSGSVLMERLRVCGRLGRKLVSHGVMAREPQANFFAVSNSPINPTMSGPSLVWQASTERLLSAEENAHFGRAAQTMLNQSVNNSITELLQIFCSGTDFSGRIHELQKIWNELKKTPGGALRIGQTTLIQAHILFLEWSLRRLPGSAFPLPTEVLGHDLVKLCRFDGQPVDQFRRFCERALSTEDASRMIGDLPKISFAAMRRTEIEPILQKLQAATCIPNSANLADPVIRKPTLTMTQVSQPVVVEPVQKTLTTTPDSGQSALLRIAREELDKMMKVDLRSFSALKASYLKSLEEPQRQLMNDVERRMKPHLFDQQLKQRLVRYMVEHPSAWKSTSQILQ